MKDFYYLNKGVIQFLIEYVRLANECQPGRQGPYIATPEGMLFYRMKGSLQRAVNAELVEQVQILYNHGYRIPDVNHCFNDLKEDIAIVILSGLIKDSNHFLKIRGHSSGVQDRVLQNIAHRQLDRCFTLIVNESQDKEYHLRLLSYASGYNNLKYVIQVLDRGIATVNHNKQHFYRVVSRGYLEIVAEFIRRGVSYNQKMLVNRHFDTTWQRRLLSDEETRMKALIMTGGFR